MIEVFPAPVGPVIAKRSNFEKSITAFCLKLVKPSISKLIGRIDRLLVQTSEEFRQFVRRCSASLMRVELTEHRVRIGTENLYGRRFYSWIVELDLQSVREHLVNHVGDSGHGSFNLDGDPQEVLAERFCRRLKLLQSTAHVS